ncbi:hypothetical protein HPB48_023790 [Haemaphysalis longicornis]|uniref:Lipase domain-containing protein n=1 Tax=Haemaphysalis longicornis TaxID=44386 RepID=A0A9J6H6R8_HAELO|nr:hypothetical protein HPB48_023790 [Haemaphysalis longicornis]
MFGIRRPPPASRGPEHVRLVVTLLVCFEKTHCLVFGDLPAVTIRIHFYFPSLPPSLPVSLVANIAAGPMSACYDELGCLNLSGFYDPKVRFVNAVPWPRVKIRTHFKFYSRKNPQEADAFPWTVTADELRDSHFEPCLETKIFVHGYLQINKVPDTPMKAIRDALLALGDFNVILVDWSSGSKYEYVQATANTRIVGLEIARLIGLLQQAFGVTTDKFHILGHSLGSHIAGYAGQKLRNLGRITALDPAQPFFEGMSPLVRLDPSDAQFVDAIHTDGTRFVLPQASGLAAPPLVSESVEESVGCLAKLQMACCSQTGIRESVTCRHERAIQFMADAMTTEAIEDPGQCAFVAYACASYELFLSGACADCGVNGERCAVMGLSSIASWRQQAELKMYLGTNDQAPFCCECAPLGVEMDTASQDGMPFRGKAP